MSDATVEHYVSDPDVYTGDEWGVDTENPVIPFNFSCVNGEAVTLGNYIYFLYGNTNYKFNTITKTYTKNADIPYSFSKSGAAPVGTDIYLFGGDYYASVGTKAYKYDTLTDTYTQLTNIPINFGEGVAVSVGTDVYLLGTANNIVANYKYDTLTGTYTQMRNIPYSFYRGKEAVAVGTDIYLFGNTEYAGVNCYKYNTLTNTYTKMTDIPYSFQYGGASAVGTKIYLFGGTNNTKMCYKYDTLTNTWKRQSDMPTAYSEAKAVTVNNIIYLMNSGSSVKPRKYIVVAKSYDTDNTVVLASGNIYNTRLFETNFENDYQPLYGFADAYFYTTQNGLDGTMPVYYGDGTQWINIKNPPQNQGGAE